MWRLPGADASASGGSIAGVAVAGAAIFLLLLRGMTPSHVDSRGIVTTASTRRGLVKTPSRRPRHVQSSKKNAESAPSSSCAAPRRPTSRAPAARKPRRWAPRKLRVDGSTAAGASSRASSAISSTRHYCRRRKRLVLGPLGLGNARRWFAVRKAQGPKLALGAAATVPYNSPVFG